VRENQAGVKSLTPGPEQDILAAIRDNVAAQRALLEDSLRTGCLVAQW
jgi:hypothetical protein